MRRLIFLLAGADTRFGFMPHVSVATKSVLKRVVWTLWMLACIWWLYVIGCVLF